MVTLGSLGATYGGLTGKSGKDFGRGNGRYVSFMDVMAAPRIVDPQLERVDVGANERQNEVRRGDVLFNGSSETPDEVALAAVVDFDVPSGVYLNSFCFGYRIASPSAVDPTYLAYLFRSVSGREIVFGLAQGATRYNISKTKLLGTDISLPPLLQQRAAAEALVEVDDLIFGISKLIAKKRAVKQGMMQKLLTGRTRLPGFAAPVPTVKLGSVAAMGSGGTPSRSVARYYGGGVPWVSISDMTRSGKYITQTAETLSDEGVSASAARIYDEGAVLYAMYASLGECCLAVGRVSSSQAILGISVGPELDREYLYYRLEHIKPQIKTVGQQGTQSNLNAGMVKDFEIPLPPLSEQRAIAEVLRDADAEIATLERRLEAARAIKQGMMQELLSGRTRLPVKGDAA